MLNGWKLYQQSFHNHDVKWSIIAGYGLFHLDMTRANGYASPDACAKFFSQNHFEKTASGRPLIYLFRDQGATNTQVHNDVAALRRATTPVTQGG
jgi:hypothetical protein